MGLLILNKKNAINHLMAFLNHVAPVGATSFLNLIYQNGYAYAHLQLGNAYEYGLTSVLLQLTRHLQ